MKYKKLKPRCKNVLVILDNKIQVCKLIREEIYPPTGDFETENIHLAIIEYSVNNKNLEVMIGINYVIFLKD